MAAKRPARASLRYAKAPLSPRYRRKLHQPLGHCYIFRLAYETLLFAGLRLLNNAPPNNMSLDGVIEGVVEMSGLPGNQSLQEWNLEQIDVFNLEDHAKNAAHAVQEALTAEEDEQAVNSAWSVIEPHRVCRRLISLSYAAISSVSRAA